MTIFRLPRWLRRLVRRNMNPMGEEQAWKMKDKLSIAYMLLAWNAFGFVAYQCAKGNKNWPTAFGVRSPEEDKIRPATAWAHTLGIKKAEVIRVSTFGGTISERDQIDTENDVNSVPSVSNIRTDHSDQATAEAELEQ